VTIDSEILFELCVCVVRNMLCELVVVLILKCVLIWLVGLLVEIMRVVAYFITVIRLCEI
jgi:hypothetical protein